MKLTQSQKRINIAHNQPLKNWVAVLDPASVRQRSIEKKLQKEKDAQDKKRRYLVKNEAELKDEWKELKGRERWLMSSIPQVFELKHNAYWLNEPEEKEDLGGGYWIPKVTEQTKLKRSLNNVWGEQARCQREMSKLMKN